MAAIRSANTVPELIVRSLVHRLGYRFRLHAKDLPGKPDLVFRSRKKVIFVHGCFWHQHPVLQCADARAPKSNLGYWAPKLARNVMRDLQNRENLIQQGWSVLIVWECEIKNLARLSQTITVFLDHQ